MDIKFNIMINQYGEKDKVRGLLGSCGRKICRSAGTRSAIEKHKKESSWLQCQLFVIVYGSQENFENACKHAMCCYGNERKTSMASMIFLHTTSNVRCPWRNSRRNAWIPDHKNRPECQVQCAGLDHRTTLWRASSQNISIQHISFISGYRI